MVYGGKSWLKSVLSWLSYGLLVVECRVVTGWLLRSEVKSSRVQHTVKAFLVTQGPRAQSPIGQSHTCVACSMVIFGCISLLAREFLFLLNWLIHSLTVLNSDLPTLHTIGSFAIFSICSLFCSLLLCNTILTCQHLYVNDIYLAVTLNIVKSDSSKLNWQTMRWDFFFSVGSHTSAFFFLIEVKEREDGGYRVVCRQNCYCLKTTSNQSGQPNLTERVDLSAGERKPSIAV